MGLEGEGELVLKRRPNRIERGKMQASGKRRTSPIDSPRIQTRAWSAMVLGLVRKKKPKVRWKREREVMMVLAEMSAIMTIGVGSSVDYPRAVLSMIESTASRPLRMRIARSMRCPVVQRAEGRVRLSGVPWVALSNQQANGRDREILSQLMLFRRKGVAVVAVRKPWSQCLISQVEHSRCEGE